MPLALTALGLIATLVSESSTVTGQPSVAAQTADSPIQCEFRVFDGDQEVTGETRLKIFPSGKRESGSTLGPADRLQLGLVSGLYDVQAVRERQGKVVSIKWAERLVVMHYPDEAGFHLEVINFKPGYGALQLRPAIGTRLDLDAFDARAAKPGAHAEEAGRAVRGKKYLLLVVPSGSYDIQLRTRAATERGEAAEDEGQWLTGIEVPADRTRLKSVTMPAKR